MQSRWLSFVEAVASTAVGFVISMALVSVVLPAFGYLVSAPDAFWITSIFTVSSIARSFIVRRLFNGYSRSKAQALEPQGRDRH